MADVSIRLAPANSSVWPAFVRPAILGRLAALRRLRRRNARRQLLDRRGSAPSQAERWASMVVSHRL